MCTKEYNPSLGSWSVGEMFCLKLLPQFLSYLNETCYTWSLWLVYMHYILFLRPGQRVLKLWPLFELLQYSYNLHFLWQSGYMGLLITISESPSLCCGCFHNWNSTDNATIFFILFFLLLILIFYLWIRYTTAVQSSFIWMQSNEHYLNNFLTYHVWLETGVRRRWPICLLNIVLTVPLHSSDVFH